MRAHADYKAAHPSGAGSFAGTSNVHFAHRYDVMPIGTVAHEWMMGIAAMTGEYTKANEVALHEWVRCFGNNLSIALTDTFGTAQFLTCFERACTLVPGGKSYAELFAGVRQDSGDPTEFVKTMRAFYDKVGVKGKKTIVFSDSLDVAKCLEYKIAAEAQGFNVSFGVGTFLTNDFEHRSAQLKGKKSVPLNIVIKTSNAYSLPPHRNFSSPSTQSFSAYPSSALTLRTSSRSPVFFPALEV